jgi:hypothetical protein
MSRKIFSFLTILTLVIALVPYSTKAVTITTGDLVVADTACKGFPKDAVYYVSGSELIVFPYLSVYLSHGFPADFSVVKRVSCSDLDSYTVKGYAKFREGTAFRSDKQTIYGNFEARSVFLMEDGKMRPIKSCSVYNALFGVNDCKSLTYWVPDAFIDTVKYEIGPMVEDLTVYPKGIFVQLPDGSYGVTGANNTVRKFSSLSAVEANRYNINRAAKPNRSFTESTPITGAESSLLAIGVHPIATTGPLTVTLASDTPAAATVPYGATSVPVLKFNVSGSGTINEVVIKRTGVGSASDFTAVYLYDGYTRLTSGRSISSETNEVTFVNLNLSAPRTLTVKVDLADSSSNAGHQSAFSVKSLNGSSVTNVVGNTITIGSVRAGSAEIAESSSGWSVTLGSSNAEVAKFSIRETSGTADLTINAITLRNGGSLSNSYIKNLVLKTGSTILATASEMTNDKAVLVLSTPYTIAKGQTKQFVLYADLRGGRTNDTIKFYLDETSDLDAVDATYGYGVRLTNNWALNDQIVTMAGGTITLGFNGPVASNYAKNTTNNDFLKFTISSERNVTVRKVKLNMYIAQTNGAYLKNIKIVDLDTGTTLVGPLSAANAGTWDTDHYYKEFSDAFDVTAGTSRHLSVRADIDTNFPTDNTIKISLDLSGSNYVYDNDAGEYVSSSNIVPNTLTGNVMTVKEAKLNVSKLATPVSGTYIKGSSDVPVLGVGLNAVADNLKVNKIIVRLYADDDGTFDNSGYGDYAANNLVSTVSLYEGSTKVAGPVNISLVGTIGQPGGYYKAEFNNLAYQVAKGASKNLTVKVNLLNTFSGSKYLAADILPSEDMEVEDSQGNLLTNLSTSHLNLNASPNPLITCAQMGTLSAAVDSSTPASSLVAFGSTGYIVSKFRFTARNEAFVITGAKLILENADSSRSVSKVILTYPKDEAGNTETKEGYFSNGAVTFPDGELNIYVKKDGYAILTVKVDVNTKEAGATNEDPIRIGLDKQSNDWADSSDNLTNDFVAVGQSSGEKIYGNTNSITMNNAPLKIAYAMESYPTVALNATSPSGNLVPSANTLVAKFDVTAHANNDITFENADSNQLVVKFAVSGADNADATVSLTDGVNTLCTGSINFTTTQTFTCNFASNSLTVPAGQTKTLYLYVDTVTAGLTNSGDSIQAYLDDDSDNNVKFGIDGSGNYAYGTIILRGKIYGHALVKP